MLIEHPTYLIAGKRFYQQPVTLGQARLLLARFKGYPLFSLQVEDLIGLLGEQVTAILAIVLIDEGTTLLEKVKGGSKGLTEFEAWLDVSAEPAEVAKVVSDFFELKQLARVLQLMPAPKVESPVST